MEETIYNIVKTAENNLLNGQPIKLGKYAYHDHAEKIGTIDAYLNSQHISGPTDSLGREKPFFNICLMAVHTWFKATDIDRKNIRFKSANSKQRIKALLATLLLRNWMNKHNFGAFLNKWGWGLSSYGSKVTKFVEKDGELVPSVISWDRLICDPVDFENNPKIEKLYFTPAQLRKQPYDEDKIEEAIKANQEARTNLEDEKIDVQNEYIGLYEVHGELELAHLKIAKGKEPTDSDWTTYRQQMHVLFINPSAGEDDKYEGVTLYSGKESKDPYYISHLIEQDGRTLSIGAVELLFDSQWMANHSAKQIKDQLDLASKMLLQTSDTDFLGRNVHTDIDTGDILIHKKDEAITQINNQSHDIPTITSFLEQWKALAKEVSNSFESVTGEQPPSGTPFRLQALIRAEGRGFFDMMHENKGLHLEEMMRKYVLPHFKKTLKNSDEIVELLEGEELENFDKLMLPAKLESELRARLMQGEIPTREELMMAVTEQNEELGSARPVRPSEDKAKTWAEYFEDFDWEAVEVEITGENTEKNVILETLYKIFQTLMTSDPARLQDKNTKKVFNKLLDELGPGILSPLQLSAPQAGQPSSALAQGTAGGSAPTSIGAGIGQEVGAPV